MSTQKQHEQIEKLFEDSQALERADVGKKGMFDYHLIAPYSHGKAPKPSTWTKTEYRKK